MVTWLCVSLKWSWYLEETRWINREGGEWGIVGDYEKEKVSKRKRSYSILTVRCQTSEKSNGESEVLYINSEEVHKCKKPSSKDESWLMLK